MQPVDLPDLLLPREVDQLLRYPRGRTAKLARARLIAHIRLPDGEIRIERSVVEELLRPRVVQDELPFAMRLTNA